ncbi:MAG: hypothetical protein AB7E61_06920 [Acholeplasmataceae bacterium]
MKPCLCDDMTKIIKFFMNMVADPEILKFDDLKFSEAKLIPMIHKFPNQSFSFYSTHLFLENGSFTYIAKQCRDKGYLEIISNPKDKRSKLLILTNKGIEMATLIESKIELHLENKLKQYQTEDRELLINAFYYMLEAIDKVSQ